MYKVHLITSPMVNHLQNLINDWMAKNNELTIMGVQTTQVKAVDVDKRETQLLLATILYEGE